jgi:hypothetical protein
MHPARSAPHHGEAADPGDALRDGAVDVAAVGRVARVTAEAALLRPQLHAATPRHRAAEQGAPAGAQRRRVARRRVQSLRRHQGEQREREHYGSRSLAHDDAPRSLVLSF